MYMNEHKLKVFTRSNFIKLNQTAFTPTQNLQLLSLAFISLFIVKNSLATSKSLNNNSAEFPSSSSVNKNNISLIKRKLFKFVQAIYKETKMPESAITTASNFNIYLIIIFLAAIKHATHEQLTWMDYEFCLKIFDLIFQAKLGPLNILKDPKLAYMLLKAFKAFISRLHCLACAEPLLFLNKNEIAVDFAEKIDNVAQKYMASVEVIYSDSSYVQPQKDSQYLYNSVDCQISIVDLVSKCIELTRLQLICVNFKLKQCQDEAVMSSSASGQTSSLKQHKKDLTRRQLSNVNKIISIIQANESFRIKTYTANKYIKCGFSRNLFKKSLFKFLAQNTPLSKKKTATLFYHILKD